MWFVRIALSRPYTFIVLAITILLLGIISIKRTPADIFPAIKIPIISVLWQYNGMPPEEFANFITSVFERAVTTTVNNIEHIESESIIGLNVVKLFFQPDVNINAALAEVTSISQTIIHNLPRGVRPPLILTYDASTVPIMQLILSSSILSGEEVNDLANNFVRTQLATVHGAAIPYPYGGKVRQIDVDLNTQAMQNYGISAQDVSNAVNQQSLTIPAGTQKIGPYEYIIKLNTMPYKVEDINNMPIKSTPNHVLYIRDVAHVHDGFQPQTNIVNVNGKRSVMMPVLKTGNSSTLDIIKRIKARLPIIKENMPATLSLAIINDQSFFVIAAIKGVFFEAVTAGILTACMILIFIGSLRSTFIITISIPLAMLSSLTILSMLGETINIMTLGGLALAVGILVDDATVAIENINWNIEQNKPLKQAILDSAGQIATPALVSTLCICVVFLPMFFLGGVSQYLFVPLAEAVIFAMLSSYILSRTLIPTLAGYLLHEKRKDGKNSIRYGERFHKWFESRFNSLQQCYYELLHRILENTKVFMIGFLLFTTISLLLLWPWLGSNFFPTVDGGQIKLHIRAATGTRVEETAKLVGKINSAIRQIIPAKELDNIVDNIGLPTSTINLSYSNSGTVGPEDADIYITLKSQHRSTESYIIELREKLNLAFPGISFAFLPADMINQILNFGLPSAINLEIMGHNAEENAHYAQTLLKRLKHIPGIVDARIQQANNYPELVVEMDRSRASELGFTANDIASNLLISLSGSFQTAPNFWIDPKNGVSYPIVSQTPQYAMNTFQALRNIPITNQTSSTPPQILGAMAQIKTSRTPAVISHYNVQPVIDIYASMQQRDLGSITKDINKIITETKIDLPKGSQVLIHGQMNTQQQAFKSLYFGLLFSIVIVYLLIVVNFQSWTDPFIIISALPTALAGIAWMLFLTHTPLSVPALTGAIMCMGVATANSVLVISFARQLMKEGKDLLTSALQAGFTRLRPVLMTATAMVIGMLPMSLGLGAGGEQNAPLGRAVIGGLLFATVATLFFVPTMFKITHSYKGRGQKNA